MKKKLTKILLFSGGSDSVLISHLYEPDYLVYVNMHTRYSEEEIKKIKEGKFGNDPRLRFIDFPFLGQYEREDAIIPLRNLYLPMIICNYFDVETYGDLDICLGATAGDRVLDKSPDFVAKFNDLINYLYLPQHWIPEGRKINLNIDYKKYTKTEMLKLYKNKGGDIEKLYHESFSCYDPVDGKECGHCKPCFRKRIAYALNGMKFNKEDLQITYDYIMKEIYPQIKAGTYGRADEEKEIKEFLDLYKKNLLFK